WAPLAGRTHLYLAPEADSPSSMDESGGWETGPRELFWSLLDTPDSAPFVASLLEKFYRPERHRIIRADVG
ncbi:MAG: hypothetical protein ACRDIF_07850, partial [Actinomycetota bacterium]